MRRVDQIAKAVVADTCAIWNILSSAALYRACVVSGFEFAITEFVLYECLYKPRKVLKAFDLDLQDRLKAARNRQQFKSYDLSVDDLREVELLEQRKRVSKGELSSIAFARRVMLAVQTDDQRARKLAAIALADRVQTTSHVLGWLFFEGRLIDGDLAGIIEEHETFERPLRQFFREMYEEAMRCRLLARSTDSPDSA